MDKLLDDLNLNMENEWDSIVKCKSKRKLSATESNVQYMKYIEYKECVDIDENDGFRAIESMNRINQLRLLKQKPVVQAVQQYTPQTQMVYSYPQNKSKAAKIKKAMINKVQTKVKFVNIGAVKSQWTEISEFNFSAMQKKKVDYTLKTLSEPQNVPYFNYSLLQTKQKKPYTLKVKNENTFNPETLLKNQTLSKLFNDEVIPEGEFGFFMQENTLLSLASAMKREFPFNISIIKQANKFALISDFSDNNLFSLVKSFNENSQKPVSEKEDEVAHLSIENTLVEDNFFLNSAKDHSQTNANQLKYFKLTLEGKYHIYSNARVDVLNVNGERMLTRSLFEEDKQWHNLDNKLDEILTACLMNNGCRIFEWIFSSFLSQTSHLAIGLVSRLNQSKTDHHVVNKVVVKGIAELTKLYNLDNDDFFNLLSLILRNMVQLEENGNYALHKLAYKPSMKLFHNDK